MRVIVDIGHARKTGAEGNRLEEHEVSCEVSKRLVEFLRKDGHEVLELDFPRLSNTQDLEATIREANRSGYDIGISLHCDSASKVVEDERGKKVEVANPEARGAHVCFYPGSAKGGRLALAIAERLCKLLPGRANKVQGRSGLAILKRTKMPFVLCECGFITNEGDAEVMREHPEKIAEAIREGVRDYINS